MIIVRQSLLIISSIVLPKTESESFSLIFLSIFASCIVMDKQ